MHVLTCADRWTTLPSWCQCGPRGQGFEDACFVSQTSVSNELRIPGALNVVSQNIIWSLHKRCCSVLTRVIQKRDGIQILFSILVPKEFRMVLACVGVEFNLTVLLRT